MKHVKFKIDEEKYHADTHHAEANDEIPVKLVVGDSNCRLLIIINTSRYTLNYKKNNAISSSSSSFSIGATIL